MSNFACKSAHPASPARATAPGCTPRTTCDFCTGLSHTIAHCYKLRDPKLSMCSLSAPQNAAIEPQGCTPSPQRTLPSPPVALIAPDPLHVAEHAACASLRLITTSPSHTDTLWIADTGATSHMTPHCRWFITLEPLAVAIRVANNHVVYSESVGTIRINPTGIALDSLILSRVLYIPALQDSLLSVLHLVAHHAFTVVTERAQMRFLQRGELLFTVTIRYTMAWLDVSTANAPEMALRSKTVLNHPLWHRRLCHLGKNLLERMLKEEVVTSFNIVGDAAVPSHCKPCIIGKNHRDAFPSHAPHHATSILECVAARHDSFPFPHVCLLLRSFVALLSPPRRSWTLLRRGAAPQRHAVSMGSCCVWVMSCCSGDIIRI